MVIISYIEPVCNNLHRTTYVTPEWIESNYFPLWKFKMKQLNREKQISLENCIEDFITIHWAKKDNI